MRVPPSFSSSSRSSPAFFDLDYRSSTLSLALDLRHDTTPPFVLALVCAPRVSLFFLPPPPALAPSLSPFLLLAHNICVVALLSSVVIIQCCTVLLTNTGIGVERGLSKGDRHIADVALARAQCHRGGRSVAARETFLEKVACSCVFSIQQRSCAALNVFSLMPHTINSI